MSGSKVNATATESCNGGNNLPWTKRSDTPFKVMFNTATVGDSVYLFPDYMTKDVAYLHNYCNNEYVDIKNFGADCYKYDGVEGKLSVFTQYPSTATSMYKTVSFDPTTGKCWVVGGTHDMFSMFQLKGAISESDDQKHDDGDGLARTQWDLDYNFCGVTNTTGPMPASIHVLNNDTKSCRFHMIGGHNSRYHEVWDSKQRRMRPVYEFATRLKARELTYVAEWDALFMIGGCLWEGTNFKDTVRFRYINDFYRCINPNDVDHIKWEKMEGEAWKLPYNMMGFGHLLLDGTKLVIFGGRVNGGEYIDEIWMFDMKASQWFQSTLRIPQKGKYRAALIGSIRQIELFQYGHPSTMNQAHFSIKVDDLMASMRSVPLNKMPATTAQTSTEKVRMHNQRVFEEQQSKFCPADKTPEAAILEIQNNKELSNRQKRKLIRKIKQKTWKYTKPSPFAMTVATAIKPNSLLPPTDHNGNVVKPAEDQISVSLDRGSPVSSDNGEVKYKEETKEEENSEDLEELIKKLENELMKVKAERDGLMKTVMGLTQNLGQLQGVAKENEKLKAQLGVQGVSAQ